MKYLYIMIAICTLNVGCKDDETIGEPTEKDSRDMAVGTYSNAHVLVYDKNGEETYEQLDFTVSKGNENGVIYIDYDGNTYKGVNVTDYENGFTFDVESGSTDGVEYEKYEKFNYAGSSYSGIFQKVEDNVTINELRFAFTYPNNEVIDYITVGGDKDK